MGISKGNQDSEPDNLEQDYIMLGKEGRHFYNLQTEHWVYNREDCNILTKNLPPL